ncbi:Serine aminopeptidase S33 [Arabidopsis suecica]|uniref:Serine aminopeptidase S33 n=1 Tax=Arabidopsis suecica TaxID=45249 RepID=A0A8T1ZC13_ARASU|nr:Serine aminopeptidase S33 [Arabidopsis suecica]KAG7556091.1 Serine aminopeptidase S33 [Arabidopsis suecica]
MMFSVMVAILVCLIGYIYRSFKPPPPRICGVPNGPLVTSPRIKLDDGRYLAYRESGVDRANANYKIIVVHGFNSSKDVEFPIPKDLIEELGIYFLFYDRAGYGESDPHPSRTVKSEAYDIQELADKLEIGPKFYVLGISLGAYSVYSCLKYIPHRLAGAVLVVPFVNYWWTKVPQDKLSKALELMPKKDQWTFRVAHYVPWLLYWWLTQKLFPSSSMITGNNALCSDKDLVIIKKKMENPSPGMAKVRQQGDHECLHRDMIAGFATWEFDPTELENPFAEGEGSVHVWQGMEDRIIPYEINRYISHKLPWIKYHEVLGYGHLLNAEEDKCKDIIKALLVN